MYVRPRSCICVFLLLLAVAAIAQPPEHAESRFQAADAAIAKLDQQIAAAQAAQPPDTGFITRLRKDRVAALRDRQRWTDALEQADELRRSGAEIPPYVLQAEADCLLALRRPEQARVAYQAVIAADPANQAAHIGLFFSQVESEDFRAAFATIDALAQREKEAANAPAEPGASAPVPKVSYQITAGLARYYASMDEGAWRRLSDLAQQSPNLGYLRTALGKVAAARGWQRRGAEEVEIGAQLSPSDLGSQIAVADSRIWLREYADARSRAESLAHLYPEELAVKHLVQDALMIYRWSLDTEFDYYHEFSGRSNPRAPGTGLSTDNHIYSPLIGDHWRVVGSFAYTNANPIEGFVERYRQGAGLEWRRSFFTAEADGWANAGTLNRGGASLKVDWKTTDHLDVAANAELLSPDTPLRAILHGITANEAGAGIGYEWHESRGLATSFHAYHFSDTNQRYSGGFRFAQKLVNQPHFNLMVRPEVFASGNTLSTAPYYNPSRDFSFFATADADHIIRRRYERVWRQRFSGGAGAYREQGYGTAPIATAIYEQTIEFNSVTVLRYGVNYSRRVYDAEPTDSVTASIALTRRF